MWLWRFSLDPLSDELDAPTGTAVGICALLGVPFARLRAALPDELLTWDMGTALGRRFVLSKKGMSDTHAIKKALLGNAKPQANKPADLEASAGEAAAPAAPPPPLSEEAVRMELFVGTCLVLAFLQVAQLVPVTELALKKSAAKRFFAGVKTPAGWDFAKTQTDFVTLLSPGSA